ncbi:hypothetical protein [Sagittula sp. SSi028]|uniref:hypothetical protein n=1 Tax=Sagittula sp. SSi028 TaxID=3400636 RepID=UPI003AF90BC8
MKRFITATALTTVIATGAFAANQFDTNTIHQYIPEVDVSTLSDQQVAALVSIATSEDEADKEREMRAYIDTYRSPAVTKSVTVVPADEVVVVEKVETEQGEYYDNVIASYLPNVDVDSLSDQQKAALISIATESASENDKEREMRAYLMN